MDWELVRTIVNAALLIIAILAGGYLVKFKRKLKAACALLSWLDNSLEDDKVSEEEWNVGFEKLQTLIHDCPGKEPPGERKKQVYLIIAIVVGAAFLIWYLFVRGW